MWRACKAPSRVQWYSKLHPFAFSVFFAVWRACKAPLVFSGTQKLHPLVLGVCVFFFLPAGRIHEARVSEKKSALYTVPGCTNTIPGPLFLKNMIEICCRFAFLSCSVCYLFISQPCVSGPETVADLVYAAGESARNKKSLPLL